MIEIRLAGYRIPLTGLAQSFLFVILNQTHNYTPMQLLLRWTASAMAIAIIAWLLPGVDVDSFWTAMIVAAVLALLNIFVKPVLIFLTIPVTILTLGLFILIINAIIILMASSLVNGFHVDSFWWALLFSLLNSLLNALINNSEY